MLGRGQGKRGEELGRARGAHFIDLEEVGWQGAVHAKAGWLDRITWDRDSKEAKVGGESMGVGRRPGTLGR